MVNLHLVDDQSNTIGSTIVAIDPIDCYLWSVLLLLVVII
jgi:hypothetical protein